MTFSDGRRLRPPVNVTSVALGDPHPDRIAQAEELRRRLPEPSTSNDDDGDPDIPDAAVAMGCRLGVATAASHFGLSEYLLGKAVTDARLRDPDAPGRAVASYSVFCLRRY